MFDLRQMTVLWLIVIAGVGLMLWQHASHTTNILQAIAGWKNKTSGTVTANFSPVADTTALGTNDPTPNIAGAENGNMAILAQHTTSVGGGAWSRSPWDTLNG